MSTCTPFLLTWTGAGTDSGTSPFEFRRFTDGSALESVLFGYWACYLIASDYLSFLTPALAVSLFSVIEKSLHMSIKLCMYKLFILF